MKFLEGVQVLNLAYNAPGPVAARRLQTLGTEVVKVEPPGGDPLSHYCPGWYMELITGQTVLTLDLKQPAGKAELEDLLSRSDLLITSVRLDSLERLGLGWKSLHARYPRLCHVAITGGRTPDEERPGHDLTYLAEAGLLDPPEMPRTLVADLAGAERAVSEAIALLFARERGQGAGKTEVPLAEAATAFAAPWKWGITKPGGVLSGEFPGYRLYPTMQGWIAVATLEEVFWRRLYKELGFHSSPSIDELGEIFLEKTAQHWQTWAEDRGLPIAVVA